jgi:hypothetical protein
MQYTLRGVTADLDNVLRELARKEGKSLNETALQMLRFGAGMDGQYRFHDLDEFIGSWIEEERKATISAMDELRQVDSILWL